MFVSCRAAVPGLRPGVGTVVVLQGQRVVCACPFLILPSAAAVSEIHQLWAVMLRQTADTSGDHTDGADAVHSIGAADRFSKVTTHMLQRLPDGPVLITEEQIMAAWKGCMIPLLVDIAYILQAAGARMKSNSQQQTTLRESGGPILCPGARSPTTTDSAVQHKVLLEHVVSYAAQNGLWVFLQWLLSSCQNEHGCFVL